MHIKKAYIEHVVSGLEWLEQVIFTLTEEQCQECYKVSKDQAIHNIIASLKNDMKVIGN